MNKKTHFTQNAEYFLQIVLITFASIYIPELNSQTREKFKYISTSLRIKRQNVINGIWEVNCSQIHGNEVDIEERVKAVLVLKWKIKNENALHMCVSVLWPALCRKK